MGLCHGPGLGLEDLARGEQLAHHRAARGRVTHWSEQLRQLGLILGRRVLPQGGSQRKVLHLRFARQSLGIGREERERVVGITLVLGEVKGHPTQQVKIRNDLGQQPAEASRVLSRLGTQCRNQLVPQPGQQLRSEVFEPPHQRCFGHERCQFEWVGRGESRDNGGGDGLSPPALHCLMHRGDLGGCQLSHRLEEPQHPAAPELQVQGQHAIRPPPRQRHQPPAGRLGKGLAQRGAQLRLDGNPRFQRPRRDDQRVTPQSPGRSDDHFYEHRTHSCLLVPGRIAAEARCPSRRPVDPRLPRITSLPPVSDRSAEGL